MPITESKIKKQTNKPFQNYETKAERFKRLAETRTNTVLEKIRVLGNCADKRTYEYAYEDIDLIFSVIEKELKKIKMRFIAHSKPAIRFGFPKE